MERVVREIKDEFRQIEQTYDQYRNMTISQARYEEWNIRARLALLTGLTINNLDSYLNDLHGSAYISNAIGGWPEDGDLYPIGDSTIAYLKLLFGIVEGSLEGSGLKDDAFIKAVRKARRNTQLQTVFSAWQGDDDLGTLTVKDLRFCAYRIHRLFDDTGRSYKDYRDIFGRVRGNATIKRAFRLQADRSYLKHFYSEIDVTIRPYQEEGVEHLLNHINDPANSKIMGILRLPTGSGKTTVANEFVDRFLKDDDRNTVLWVTKNWEILYQSAESLSRGWSHHRESMRRIGGSGRTLAPILPEDDGGRIYYTTLHTLANKHSSDNLPAPIRTQRKGRRLVIYDECHWAVNAHLGRTLLEYYLPHNRSHVIGLSATPKNKAYRRMPYDFRVAYEKSWSDLLDYLANPIVEFIETGIEWEPIFTHGTEMITQESLRDLADNDKRNRMIVDRIMRGREEDQFSFIVLFACNIEHANELENLLNQRGIPAACLHSQMDREPYQVINDFRNRRFEVIVNVEMFTHGIDVPEIDTVVLARPTESGILCAQMVGRGSRRTENKKAFTVVEVTDNIVKYSDYIFRASELIDYSVRDYQHPERNDDKPVKHGIPETDPVIRDLPSEWLDIGGIPYVLDQTFGIEIELTSRHGKPNKIGKKKWQETAQEIIDQMKSWELDVYGKPLKYHERTDINEQWRVEKDSSCGWEIISPIIKNEAGFRKIIKLCEHLEPFVDTHDHLKVNYRTGLHVTLATRLETNELLAAFLRRVQRLERGLFTLVSPSRRYKFKGRKYDLDSTNEYCAPISEIDTEDELDELYEFLELSDESANDLLHEKRYRTVNFTHFPEDIELMEIRMHQGTVMFEKIIPWISLWMLIFNHARFEWRGPGFPGEIFEGGNKAVKKDEIDSEDIFHLLKEEGIALGPRLKEILFNRRKELAERWKEVIPRRVKSWEKHGWYN